MSAGKGPGWLGVAVDLLVGALTSVAPGPRAVLAPAATDGAGADAAGVLGALEMPQHGKILIVDDDAAIRATARHLLKRVGFDVLEAENGARAAEVAAAEIPDLIILDWDMPVLDGPGAIVRLRTDARTRTIPIVMLTWRSARADLVAALEAGAQDYVIKPIERLEFTARVKQQLRWRRLLTSDVKPEPDAPGVVEPAPEEPARKRPIQEAMDRGDLRGALDIAVAEAERAEAELDYLKAAGCYRGGSAAATKMGNPDLANKLLRLAGKMYLLSAESARADGKAIEDAYALAARMFMAAGNLRLARKVVQQAG